jgi:peroxin-3
VLAILPTAYENLVEALPVEQTLAELQRQKEDRLAKSTLSEGGSTNTDMISVPGSEDGKSHMSFTTDSYVHASQTGESIAGDSQPVLKSIHSKKSKLALWNDMKISGMFFRSYM